MIHRDLIMIKQILNLYHIFKYNIKLTHFKDRDVKYLHLRYTIIGNFVRSHGLVVKARNTQTKGH